VPDPISIAVASFGAIKAGVAAGKEIQSLAKDIGSLWDSIDAVKQDHAKKKNSPLNLSVNEEAMQTFMAKKQAEDLEDELRTIITYSRGISAWQELIRLRGDIRRERAAALALKQKQRREMLETIGISILALAIVSTICVLGYFIIKKKMNV